MLGGIFPCTCAWDGVVGVGISWVSGYAYTDWAKLGGTGLEWEGMGCTKYSARIMHRSNNEGIDEESRRQVHLSHVYCLHFHSCVHTMTSGAVHTDEHLEVAAR